MNSKQISIGVFYDGNYFLHVNNYYNYYHEKKQRISISGLHAYIKAKVADLLNSDTNTRNSQIVDSHYFRGRLNAKEAYKRGNLLYFDRAFEDLLMMEGVTTHYHPLKNVGDTKQEKGIDVWLALEAYEQTQYKKFDAVVLIASDGDFVPLVRKLHTLGTKVIVGNWDFEYVNEDERQMITKISKDLRNECWEVMDIHLDIDNPSKKYQTLMPDMFIPAPVVPEWESKNTSVYSTDFDGDVQEKINSLKGQEFRGEIVNINHPKGFGFVTCDEFPNNVFFHQSSLSEDTMFSDLGVGSIVTYQIEYNEVKNQPIARLMEIAIEPGNRDYSFDSKANSSTYHRGYRQLAAS